MISSKQYNKKCLGKSLPILSLNKLAHILGIPREKLEKLAEKAPSYYFPFKKKTGDKLREIDNPTGFLKEVQGKINDRILSEVVFPEYVIGGVKGRKPSEHPNRHIKKSVVVTFDVKDCFPNITNRQIFDAWHKQLGCSHEVARLVTKLTTRCGHLPLGAPTSVGLANLTLQPCLVNVIKVASQYGFFRESAGQYVDDLAFSGDSLSEEFILAVIKEFSRYGFRIKRKKILVMRANQPQIVTKKVVNRKVSVPLGERRKIRAAFYELKNTNPSDHNYSKRYKSMLGRINALKEFHPGLADKMLEEARAFPHPDEVKAKEVLTI